MKNEARLRKMISAQNAIDNLMVAIGERAIKDYEYAMRKYMRIAKWRPSKERSAKLFRVNHRMNEASYFFLKDPYDIFPNGGGKQIIALLQKKNGFVPVTIPTKEEYDKIMKSLEKWLTRLFVYDIMGEK